MRTLHGLPTAVAASLGLVVSGYLTHVVLEWTRYGRARRGAGGENSDELLDRFMPVYEVHSRHHVRVDAPANITLAAAYDMSLWQSGVVRAIIRARELILGARPTESAPTRGFLDEMQEIGWGVLAAQTGSEMVFGAVTQPWQADVRFRALPPEEFAAFQERRCVKIAWTLRVDPIDARHSVFTTETRAVATDPEARSRFRWYWAFFSPGMVLIRKVLLRQLKREAERRS